MSQKRSEMDELQELVRLHRMGTGYREVARLLGMSPNTERQYREVLAAEGLLAGAVEVLPELAELRAAVSKHLGQGRAPQQTSSVESWSETVETMIAKGATPKAIYDCLRLEHEGFRGSLSAIKRLYARLRGDKEVEAKDVAIAVVSGPGEIAQVDFGYVGKLYDPEQGVLRKAWVFVLVLAYSRHLFARIVFDQRVRTWVAVHVEAFEKLGGVVDTIVPDNLKAAVIRAVFGFAQEPALNRSYREVARHYGFKVDPTPPYSPEKKGIVESAVKYVKRNFFAPRSFDDVHDANRRLDAWTEEIAGDRVHATTQRRPLDLFEIEKAHLRPLPPARFECIEWKQATVHQDSQIEFDRRLYPVPWRLIGKRLWVQASPHTIAVYWEETRVATHQRNKPVAPGVYDQYAPNHRSDLRYRSQSFWIDRAERLGGDVVAYVREIFACDDVLSQLRTVQAVVTHIEKFPPERAQAACRRAQYYGNYTYVGVRDILRQGLDSQPLPGGVGAAANKAEEQPRYARNITELLELSLLKENIDDAHKRPAPDPKEATPVGDPANP